MNRVRTFLAACLSVGVTRRIAEEVSRRKDAVSQAGLRVAWVPAANLHVTLKFIGSIPEELIEGIALKLGRVAAKQPPFEARARGFGAFPSLAQPKVLWVGVEAEPLVKLQRAVEDAMAELGIEKEERAFHPHLTVGRVKEQNGNAAVPWGGDEDLGSSTVNEIVVYESRTLKSGSEYIARARVALGKET